MTNWSLLPSAEECAARIERLLVRYGEGSRRVGPFCVVDDEGKFAGLIGLDVAEPFDGRHELWYLLCRDCWGRGYGTAAVAEMLAVAASTPGVSTLVASAAASNAASWRILERRGFRRTGIAPNGFDENGVTADVFGYACVLTAHEDRAPGAST